MQTYLFYDLETTGLHKCFDQAIEYAGIRTDLSGNILDQKHEMIKLRDDVIPSPEALYTHQHSPDKLSKGLCEYEAICKIHADFNTEGTITLGYNSLNFDDEMLRFHFYRNLLPPYTHQYANQCARMDLFPITTGFWLFCPEALSWPIVDNRVSLKLAHLNQENHWVDARSHEALNDVLICIKLQRALEHANPAIWKYFSQFFDKNIDKKRIQQLPTWGLMIDPKIGSRANFLAPVLYLGEHAHYCNQTLWLRLDTPQLSIFTVSDIEKIPVLHKKYGEAGFVLPPEDRYLSKLSAEQKEYLAINLDFCKTHSDFIKTLQDFAKSYRYPQCDNADSDARLYLENFWPNDWWLWLRTFHRFSLQEKYACLLDKTVPARLKEMIFRLMARNYPDVLSNADRDIYDTWKQSAALGQLLDFKGVFNFSLYNAHEAFSRLKAENQESVPFLSMWEKYLQDRAHG